MAGPVVLEGQAKLLRALAKADRESRLAVRRELRAVAEPVSTEASSLALQNIRNMPKSPKWARMRIGVTRNLVYIVPRQKGSRGRGPTRRHNLAGLLWMRAMAPAEAHNARQLKQRVETALDRIADVFNHGGAV